MTERKGPKIIKRYQNRKLYDTQDSCYVVLEDIREMIKHGEDVQVIDNTTKEDLTSVTLAQIILEEEKKHKSLLPLGAFKEIIASSGETLRDFVQRSGENIARDFGVVKEFVDKQIRPTLESVQSIPTVASEIRSLRSKIDQLEKKLKDYEQKNR